MTKHLLAILTVVACCASQVFGAKRPDVLFVIVDDLRPELACYGKTKVHSPNIDRLAAKGMRFDRAYCQYPICNPSRTSFLTGLRPQATQVFGNDTYFRDKLPNVVTLPELFRTHGYHTVSIGKTFHNGGKLEGHNDDGRSWTKSEAFKVTQLGRKGDGRAMTSPGGNAGWCQWLAAEGDDNDQMDGQSAAEAVRILNEPRDEPLFLAVGLNKPHDPFIAPKKYFDLYPPATVTPPTVPERQGPHVPLAIHQGLDFSKFTDQDRHEFLRAYMACTSYMDAQLGKVLAVLDRDRGSGNGWDNTIVVFFGDHGYHLGEHSWWNKGTLFEESARVPLIVWAPNAVGMGRSTTALAELVDLYPTLCDLCGISPPAGLQGTSLRPVLDDPKKSVNKMAETVVKRGDVMGRSIRTDRWRYTEWDGGKEGVELYDQQDDPDDYVNLADDPAHTAVLAELKQMMNDER